MLYDGCGCDYSTVGEEWRNRIPCVDNDSAHTWALGPCMGAFERIENGGKWESAFMLGLKDVFTAQKLD